MSYSYKEVKETDDVRNNGLKKVLVIGKTGTGKSTLCNVLTENDHDAEIYPVSAGGASCTQSTKLADIFFNGDQSCPITLIDTMGFDDATKNHDAEIIAELVVKLKNDCDHINLFLLVLNGQAVRLDASLLAMLKIFQGMFSEEFWKQVVVVFTQVSMDKKSKNKRETNTKKKTDEETAKDYIHLVEKELLVPPSCEGLRYLYLDATYDKTDDDERAAFNIARKELWEWIEESPPLSTDLVQEVKTENRRG